jgi:hypothetical protein
MTTPRKRLPTLSSFTTPSLASFLPLQRLGSQWSKSCNYPRLVLQLNEEPRFTHPHCYRHTNPRICAVRFVTAFTAFIIFNELIIDRREGFMINVSHLRSHLLHSWVSHQGHLHLLISLESHEAFSPCLCKLSCLLLLDCLSPSCAMARIQSRRSKKCGHEILVVT